MDKRLDSRGRGWKQTATQVAPVAPAPRWIRLAISLISAHMRTTRGLRRVKRTRCGKHPHEPQGACIRRSVLRPAVVGHALGGVIHLVADVEVEIQLDAGPLELGSILAIIVEHHDICVEKGEARVCCLEFAVSDCGEGLARVKKVVGIVFSFWGECPTANGGVVEFETIYARIQGRICARVEPEAERLGSVAERKKRVGEGVGDGGSEMEGDVVEDLVWHGVEGCGHGGLWEEHPRAAGPWI